jgi:2,3-bisphosphoglycerate-independent phosphoglycerate mutase
MKVVVVHLEGAGDEPIEQLGGKTPLEVAKTPNLDHLAARGIFGLTRTVPGGMAPERSVGTLAVLGYDPERHRVGTAALEAAGAGVELAPEDVVFRSNLVTLETPEGGVEVLRDFAAGHLPSVEARELVLDVNRAIRRVGVQLIPGRSYRHLLVWRRGQTDVRTVPPHALVEKPVAGALPQGPGAEMLLETIDLARRILADHPLCQQRLARGERVPTAIWPWAPARTAPLPTLRERFGVSGAVVAASDAVAGLAMLAGLRRIDVHGATGFVDTDFRAKAEKGLAALSDVDLLYLHVDAPDDAGHRGDPQRKVEAIERFDLGTVGPLLEGLRQLADDWRLLVVSGHTTPCAQRIHVAEPVPFLVYVKADDAKAKGANRGFCEKDARDHGIFVAEGHSLLAKLMRR